MRRMLPVVMGFSWLVPERKLRRNLAMILALLLAAAVQAATTWHVDASRPDDNSDGRSWDTAKKTIQAAINASEGGDTILVTDGTYAPIASANKAITIRSVNGAQKTIIDGGGVARCATLGGTNSEYMTVLEGFTLQNGYIKYYGGGVQGGTLRNCTLTGNQAEYGGGAFGGTLADCTLTGNTVTGGGGGASYCTLTDCTLTENTADQVGGGAFNSTLTNCTLTENTARYGSGASYCTLAGCTLTGNTATAYGGGAYGGTLTNCTLTGNQASNGGGVYEGTLTDCTLTENTATYGGGGAHSGVLTNCTLTKNTATSGGGACGGTLTNCTLTKNTATSGGGACGGTLTNCTLTGNQAGESGGGACSSTLTNCTLSENTAEYGGGAQGGSMTNCILTGNTASWFGGGAYESTLTNCTVTGNSAGGSGGGMMECNSDNCIVWDNSAPEDANHCNSSFRFSCTSPLPTEGDGNISAEPRFVDAENGNYHLHTDSPCIDSGNNDVVQVETDLAGNPRISNETVDMGAYERIFGRFVITGQIQGNGLLSPMTIVVPPGGSATFTATETHDSFRHFEIDGVVVSELPTYTWKNIQADGVITAVFGSKTWHVDASRPDDSGNGSSWDTAKRTIQAAIDGAEEGEEILVRDGIYEPIRTGNKAITIRSVNGAQKTIIDGDGIARCATLGDYGYGCKTVLEGFTLQNGYAKDGGGACSGILRHCTLINNGSPGLMRHDSYFNFYCERGGGAYDCILSHCLLQNNNADDGGGAYKSKLTNCLLTGNQACYYNGGGAYESELINCLLTGNQAYFGGAACDCVLVNCTLTENQADHGGGIATSQVGAADSAAYNCIIWGNTAWTDANYDVESYLAYSCTYPLPLVGDGNTSLAPIFVDAVNGDFRLRTGSPGVDAGSNEIFAEEEFAGIETDLAGNPRIINNTVDMGAYEGAVDGCVISGRIQGSGILSPMTAAVAQGGSVTFIATATHSAFRHFLVNGEIVSNLPTYIWSNIQADGVITAVFADSTWHVDAARPNDNGDGLTWATAKKTIQAAIDRADGGDLILVKPGIYAPIATDDKAITIRSVNGAATTIIDGGGRQPCAILSNSYFGRQTILDGFTLQNGLAAASGGGLFGGTALNCLITSCFADGNDEFEREDGGGGASYATLRNCTLSRNKAPYGGGAEYCILVNCILTENQAYDFGGGAYLSLLSNCTITENVAQRYGGGVVGCTVYNSIVWNNRAEEEANYATSENFYYATELYYSCSTPLPPREGNISEFPSFVESLHGDFRLRSDSPCLDAGNNRFVTSATDLAGNPRIDNATVDMGALEGKIEGCIITGWVQGNGTISPLTAAVAPGGSVTFTATATGGVFQHFLVDDVIVSYSPTYMWKNIESDGIITAVFTSVTWHVDDARPDDNGDGSKWETAKKTIQAALDMAKDGDQILVKAGVYGPIDGYGKEVTVRSIDGAEVTIIDGGGTRRCALAANLVGFTLQNGLANNGGGASECALNQCILSGNTAETSGGGAYDSTLNNCRLIGNASGWRGGGAYGGTLINCLLTGNATYLGGGAFASILCNCTVVGNSATESGAGVGNCSLRNCIVWGNFAEYDEDNYENSNFVYSCSDPEPAGVGNIGADPEFIDGANGAYHLNLDSPCINAGSNDYVQESDTDLSGDPRIRYEIVDMGAYERNMEIAIVLGKVEGRGKISPQIAIVSPDDSVTFTAEETTARFLYFQVADEVVSTEPSYQWSEGDGVIIAVFAPATLYVDAARPNDDGDGLSWATAKKNLQSAVLVARDGETILVRPGCYAPINTGRKSLIIRSVDGANVTIIDGGGTQRCATLGDERSEGTELEGFTLQNGFTEDSGGGASGGRLNRCIISGNTAENSGGGAYECRLFNSLLSRNYAPFNSGGGAYECELDNCTLVGNAAGEDSGGICYCEATNCIVWDNTATSSANYYDSSLRYSCTVPLPEDDEDSNISENPHFVDAANGDFRLRTGSPCINAGYTNDYSGAYDLAGNPRFEGTDMDIGAYEGSVAGYVISGRVQGDGVLLPMTAVVPPGGSARFEAVETGPAFLHFLIDGAVVSESPNYTWENVRADGQITAVFATNTWYVDGARPDDNGDGRTWGTAKKTIQAAVEIAGSGDLILVNPGIYGPIDASIYPLVIRSVQGAEATIIDAVGKTRCATLGKAPEKTGTTLDGFTLRRGRMLIEGGGAIGGTLNNCLLTNNLSYNGGGAAYCTLNNCTLSGNSAYYGGGAWASALTYCTLIGNTANYYAGGAIACTLDNCTLTDNAADGAGGSYNSILNNCLLTGNSAEYGGGAMDCTLTNCTVSKNTATENDGGVSSCTLYNSIVWDNTAPRGANHANSVFEYSCTTPRPGGESNFDEEPLFVDAANGDYRLETTSPCVNTGNNAFAVGETDLAGNPRIRAGWIDMGALEAEGFIIIGRLQGTGWISPQEGAILLPLQQENTLFAIFVAPGASVTFTASEFDRNFCHFLVNDTVVSGSLTYTWENIQADGVITAVFESKTWYVDDDGDDNGDGSSWENALRFIQAAVDAAVNGDTILVNDGTYTPIRTGNKAITIRSRNGAAKTIIAGMQQRCANLAGDSLVSRRTILDGFTLQSGYAPFGDGGGVYGGTVRNCILLGNYAEECGGGAAYSTLINCSLVFNSAGECGGGAAYSTLINCTVTENGASRGGGIVFASDSSERVVNSIVWNNWNEEESVDNYCFDAPVASPFRYTCTDPLPAGEGNICADPLFVDAEADDFRLTAESPCINAGDNALATGDVDLDGNPRIFNGAVDMGAFESDGTCVLKYAWQSGWNTLYLPFDSLKPATTAALAEMPVFKLSANKYVKDKPVSLHTPLWVFCANPENAPVLRGVLTPGAPADPLAIPVGRWTLVGAQRQIETLPPTYIAWEWRAGRYIYVRSLQTGRVYYIYRDNAP